MEELSGDGITLDVPTILLNGAKNLILHAIQIEANKRKEIICI